jgi:hypothetical protein
MAIARRLKRLERLLTGNAEPARRSFHESMAALTADSKTIWVWLAQHGYDSCLAALAAGESGPELLTDGWSLATFGQIERNTVEEAIIERVVPGVSLWCHHARGWCAPINNRLVYLGPADDHDGAIARFQALSSQALAGDLTG